MALVADQCICLRKTEYSETSQVLALLSREHGLVRVMAKGAHRVTKQGASKFGGGIDLLDLGDAVFTDRTEKDLLTLCEWKLRDGHLDLRRSLRGLYLGFYAAELAGLLIEQRDPHPLLFERMEATLAELGTPRLEQAMIAFELHLLRQSGHLPELAACVECGQIIAERGPISFAPLLGGVICRNCELAIPQRGSIDGRLVGIMRHILELEKKSATARLPAMTRHQTDPINRLLGDYIEQMLGRRLRVLKWISGSQRAMAR